MNRQSLLLMASGLGVVLVAVAVAFAQVQPPLQPLCGYFDDAAVCQGCADHADTCTCVSPANKCKTEHKVCYPRVVTVDASNDPCSYKLVRLNGPCYWTNTCKNGNGQHEGACNQPSDCSKDEGERYYPSSPADTQKYYDDDNPAHCDPENCTS